MPAKSRSKQIALGRNKNRYRGKVCASHPEEKGTRYTASGECCECAIAKCEAYRKTPRGQANVLANNRRRRYGVSPAEFQQLLGAQQGRCAICGVAEPGGRDGTWHLDHDHRTDKPRGVLCARCNVGLGHFRDNVVTLRAAVAYLEKHSV